MKDEFLFEFEGDEPENDRNARDLLDWMDEDLRGSGRLRINGPGEGELGGAADAVIVPSGSVPLGRPFLDWLTERTKSRRITLRVSATHKGELLRIDVGDPVAAQELRSTIARLLDEA
ncbi:hypothetical protein ACFWNN_09015 [Lentzea sp. NPDC058450]|uniref:effector-associated constant component EACC1 n=1 Tax=Lentzea sp. NPDC058450 TaxID=3346505 RepID=UPI003667DD6F